MQRLIIALFMVFVVMGSAAAQDVPKTEKKAEEPKKEVRICWQVGAQTRVFHADKHPSNEELKNLLDSQYPGVYWKLKSITEPTVGDPKYRVTIAWDLTAFPYLCEVDGPKPAAKKEEGK